MLYLYVLGITGHDVTETDRIYLFMHINVYSLFYTRTSTCIYTYILHICIGHYWVWRDRDGQESTHWFGGGSWAEFVLSEWQTRPWLGPWAHCSFGYVCVRSFACIHVYTHTRTHTHARTHTHTHAHAHTHTHMLNLNDKRARDSDLGRNARSGMCVCICACGYVHTLSHTHLHAHTHMHTHTHTYIFTHTHTHTHTHVCVTSMICEFDVSFGWWTRNHVIWTSSGVLVPVRVCVWEREWSLSLSLSLSFSISFSFSLSLSLSLFFSLSFSLFFLSRSFSLSPSLLFSHSLPISLSLPLSDPVSLSLSRSHARSLPLFLRLSILHACARSLYTQTHSLARTHSRMMTRPWLGPCICVCVYMHMCVYMCVCVCVYVCVCLRERERDKTRTSSRLTVLLYKCVRSIIWVCYMGVCKSVARHDGFGSVTRLLGVCDMGQHTHTRDI